MSVDQVSKHLGVKRETIYVWINRKGMPEHKVGRLWKFKLSEIDVWVRSGKAGLRNDIQARPGISGKRRMDA